MGHVACLSTTSRTDAEKSPYALAFYLVVANGFVGTHILKGTRHVNGQVSRHRVEFEPNTTHLNRGFAKNAPQERPLQRSTSPHGLQAPPSRWCPRDLLLPTICHQASISEDGKAPRSRSRHGMSGRHQGGESRSTVPASGTRSVELQDPQS